MIHMARYPHYLRSTGPGRPPARVVCVDVQSESYVGNDRGTIRRDVLTSWSAVTLLREDGRTSYHSQESGSSARSWGHLVYDCLSRPGVTLVLSQHCGRVWPLLGLYDALEDSSLYLYPDPHRSRHLADDAIRAARRKASDPLAPIGSNAVRDARNAECGYLVCEDPPNIIVARMKNCPGVLHWIDSRNLSAAAPAGMQSGRLVADWLARWYLRLVAALETLSLGHLQHTAGSQAYHGYRHGYYYGGIYCHAHRGAMELERRGYYGGRCECYKLGTVPGRSSHLDYRSLYPWVMQHVPVPVRLEQYTDDPASARAFVRRGPHKCMARVTIDAEVPYYPYRRDTDIIYPVGRYDTVLCGEELLYAVSRGDVKAVHEAAWYSLDTPLASYAAALYQWRCEEEGEPDGGLSATAKALLVSLPGKLGQRERRWVAAPGVIPDYPWGEWWGADPRGQPCRYRCIGSYTQREEVGGWASESVPQIAAWITSAGRRRLLEAILLAGWDTVYYVDTDCLVVDYRGYLALMSSPLARPCECGYLRVKHLSVNTEVRGIKYYTVNDDVVCSGLPRGRTRDCGDGVHYWYSQSPAESVRQGHRPESVQVVREYQRLPTYRHGVVGPDGRITPIRLGES